LQSISYIVSPAVAALLYSVWELNAIIAIDVLGAVIASITIAIVRIPKLGDQVQSLKPNFIREMKEGMETEIIELVNYLKRSIESSLNI
jgi:MFS transporter, DHA3 family, macrolide efflux protein